MSPELLENSDISHTMNSKKEFYANHIFHERHMNSCPIGCEGCAVSASTSNRGALAFNELINFYKEAADFGVSLQITKVEGYDPVFVNYKDDPSAMFADTVKAAVDLGHQIITPICTTGSWKSERSIQQLAALGKLTNKYRFYRYPSGNSGEAIVLSVPREIRPFANDKYDYEQHVDKILFDLQLLSVGGKVEALIYYNSDLEGDLEFAEKLQDRIDKELRASISIDQRKNIELIITNFNSNTLPESCFRYENSVLVSDTGFKAIDPVSLEWSYESELAQQKN